VLVCHCHRVNDTRIAQILDAGADGLRGIVRATGAGAGCGGCLPMLRELCAHRALSAQAQPDEALAG
jgi:bacterioferritin-associated ferredoxin